VLEELVALDLAGVAVIQYLIPSHQMEEVVEARAVLVQLLEQTVVQEVEAVKHLLLVLETHLAQVHLKATTVGLLMVVVVVAEGLVAEV
jgi:hypothetical protein